MYCPNCGQANPDDANFCMRCGKALPRATDAPQMAVAPPAPPTGGTLLNAGAMGVTDADGIKLLELIQTGVKIEAVKYLRERTGASLRDALNAVNHLETLPRVRPYTAAEIQNAFTQRAVAPSTIMLGRRGTAAGCLGILGVIALCLALMAGMSMLMWSVSGAYTQAFERARASADVREIFGDDLAPVPGFWTGSSGSGATGTTARFQIPVTSSRRSGTLIVSGRTTGSYFGTEWTLTVLLTYTDDAGQQKTINVK